MRYLRWVISLQMIVTCPLALGAKPAPAGLPDNWVGTKVIAFAPVPDVEILLPDQSHRNLGQDFQASLVSQLIQSGKYTLIDVPQGPSVEAYTVEPRAQYVWIGSEMPSATIRLSISALTFLTGGKGDRMFYGFNERIRTPFNDGIHSPKNEFPLRTNSNQTSWFGNSFDQRGVEPFDSRAGLDLGEGFSLDALFAFLNLKYAGYHVDLHLKLEMDSPLVIGGTKKFELIEVKGHGFFFDFAGGYGGYSAGISLARKDAMNKALDAAIQASYAAIDRSLETVPWLAKVDSVMTNGLVLMGTGWMADVRAGTYYESVQNPNLILQVQESNQDGSVGKVVQGGDGTVISKGMILREINAVPKDANPLLAAASQEVGQPHFEARDVQARGLPTTVDGLQLPTSNFSPADLGGIVKLVTRAEAVLKSITGLIFLPYRIWRYFDYDQTYHAKAERGGSLRSKRRHETWQHQIGLDAVDPGAAAAVNGPEASSSGVVPIVAVIDSGVDYNHAVLHDSLWLNPTPTTDVEGRKDRYGWDFISDDSRPYDDAYHGTEVASLVVAVAPMVKLLPLKAFNPWGITNSAALYASFQYAVDHGAQVILCAWSTQVSSQTLEKAVKYAEDRGVVVVTPAGDWGLNLSVFPMYPAVLSKTFDNVLTVTSVDGNDQWITTKGKKPNFDPNGNTVQIAAPGDSLWVAEPRGGKSVQSSTGLAAAIVAGVLARNIAATPEAAGHSGSFNSSYWISQVLKDADSLPQLNSSVRGGLRVRVVR